MSSFIYVPLFFLFAALSVLYVEDTKTIKKLISYYALLTLSFCISFLYYAKFQPALFYLVYKTTVQRFLGNASDIKLAVIFIALSTLILVIYKCRYKKILDIVKSYLERNVFIILLTFFCLTLYFSYTTFTRIQLKLPVNSGEFERYWYIGANIFQKVKYLNLFVIIQYITPVGLIIFLWSIIYYRKNPRGNVIKILVIIFVLWFLLINVRFNDGMRYPYYNTRYLFSEIVVYLLLLIGVFIGNLLENGKTKKSGYVCIILICSLSLPFTFFQYNGSEGPHMEVYNKIISTVTKKDLILITKSNTDTRPQQYFDNFNTYALGPLKFYYDLNVFILPSYNDLYTKPIIDLTVQFKTTYLISDKQLDNFGIDLLSTPLRYSYYNVSEKCSLHTYSFLPLESVKTMKIPSFLECLTPPNNYYTRYSNLYMYNITDSLKN
jgi:hypothetical protein